MAGAFGECLNKSKDIRQLYNVATKMFVMTGDQEKQEQYVSALQDIIRDVRKHNEPENLIRILESEAKRMRKAGRLDLMQTKLDEIKAIKDSVERKRLKHEHLCKNLEKARAVRDENRRKREQAMRDRLRNQQPNFAKMAKKKMQKIAQRQAEKKRSPSSSSDQVKSCSMFNNVG